MKHEERDREVDHKTSDGDEGSDERRGGAGGVESDPFEQEGQHRSGQGSERNDSDEREPDGDRQQEVVGPVTEDVQVLPDHDPDEADYAKDAAEHESGRQLADRDPPPVAELQLLKCARSYHE